MNLASRPFVNERPVLRLTAALWIVAAVCLAVNVSLYWRQLSGSQSTGERLEQVERQFAEERARVGELRSELERIDLAAQNREAEWVNARIAARTFSWSTLFDRVGEALPGAVRLSSLSPKFYRESGNGREALEARASDVELTLRGTARNDQALLDLMDNFFAHPSFLAPDLASEARREGGVIEFSLSVLYRPPPPAEPATAAEPSPPAGEAPAEPPAETVSGAQP